MSNESHEGLHIPNGPELPDPTSQDGQKLAFLVLQRSLTEGLDKQGIIDKGVDALINSQHDDGIVIHFDPGETGATIMDLAEESDLNSVVVGEMPRTKPDGTPIGGIPALRFARIVKMPNGELKEAYAWVPLLKPHNIDLYNADFMDRDYELVDEAILKVDDVVEEGTITEVTEDFAGVQRQPDRPYVLYL